MSNVVKWLRERAAGLETQPYGSIAARALNEAADALELVEPSPKSAP